MGIPGIKWMWILCLVRLLHRSTAHPWPTMDGDPHWTPSQRIPSRIVSRRLKVGVSLPGCVHCTGIWLSRTRLVCMPERVHEGCLLYKEVSSALLSEFKIPSFIPLHAKAKPSSHSLKLVFIILFTSSHKTTRSFASRNQPPFSPTDFYPRELNRI